MYSRHILLTVLYINTVVPFHLLPQVQQRSSHHLKVSGDPFFDAPVTSQQTTKLKLDSLQDSVDYVVIGSGIGGLSCAALLSYYGYSVAVLESHYLPGGCAHTFERNGFKFDAGPSLWYVMTVVCCIQSYQPTIVL